MLTCQNDRYEATHEIDVDEDEGGENILLCAECATAAEDAGFDVYEINEL